MSLTLKEFRKITKDMPEDTIINSTIEFGKEWSIRGTITCVHLCPLEHTYSDDSHITLTQHSEPDQDKLIVKKLIGKNEWVDVTSFEED